MQKVNVAQYLLMDYAGYSASGSAGALIFEAEPGLKCSGAGGLFDVGWGKELHSETI